MKYLKIVSILLIGLGLGLSVYYFSFPPFHSLSSGQMHEQVVSQRDFAIKKAMAQGDYNCCVEPACTMCYMEGNQWNNHEAGTCACAGLIAKGEEPCPQCDRILNAEAESSCQFAVDSLDSCEQN